METSDEHVLGPLVAFDCETTGLGPDARLIELAAVRWDWDSCDDVVLIEQFARPPGPLPTEISVLTGLSDDDLFEAAPGADVVADFVDALPSRVRLVAHNVRFDRKILLAEKPDAFDRIKVRWIDTVEIARSLGEFVDLRLSTIANALGVRGDRHRAAADAKAVVALMRHARSRGLFEAMPNFLHGRGAD